MDANDPFLIDPVELVRQLDANAIRNRLGDLDREARSADGAAPSRPALGATMLPLAIRRAAAMSSTFSVHDLCERTASANTPFWVGSTAVNCGRFTLAANLCQRNGDGGSRKRPLKPLNCRGQPRRPSPGR